MFQIKRIIYSLILLFFSSAIFADSKILNIQEWQSHYGSKVYFVHTANLPLLDIQVIFAAGSIYDDKNEGLSAFVNSMLGESTTDMNGDQIADAFDRVGAVFDTNSDRDKSLISLRTLTNKKYMLPALKTFTDVIAKLNFPDDAVQRIRNQTVIQIQNSQQNPQLVAQNAFYQSVYGNFPYAHPILGTVDTVNAISAQQLSNFYNKFYVTNNASVVIVGNIPTSQAKDIANQILSKLPRGEAAPHFAYAVSQNHLKQIRIPFLSQQTSIIMGELGIQPNDADYFPLLVGNYVYGGLPLSSILFKEIREQHGLAYYAASSFVPLYYRGLFVTLLQTKADQTQQAINLIDSALNNFMTNGPSENQLAAAKKYIIGSFPLKLDSNTDILNVVTDMAFYQKPLDYLDTYRAAVNAVTLAEIKAAFNRKLSVNRMVTVMVGPQKYGA